VNPPPLPSDCKSWRDVFDGKCRATKAHCESIPDHQVSTDGTECVPKNCHGSKPSPINPDGTCRTYPLTAVVSRDPNDKSGPQGVGDAHYISPGTALTYDIEFENAASATAPAQVIEV
jgi:hypothetical protein